QGPEGPDYEAGARKAGGDEAGAGGLTGVFRPFLMIDTGSGWIALWAERPIEASFFSVGA
ncbi:MAG: hypothetical protein DWI24_10100, partial [Planctomycetota bacterium]